MSDKEWAETLAQELESTIGEGDWDWERFVPIILRHLAKRERAKEAL